MNRLKAYGGDAGMQCSMGNCYFNGTSGVLKDHNEAFKVFIVSCCYYCYKLLES